MLRRLPQIPGAPTIRRLPTLGPNVDGSWAKSLLPKWWLQASTLISMLPTLRSKEYMGVGPKWWTFMKAAAL